MKSWCGICRLGKNTFVIFIDCITSTLHSNIRKYSCNDKKQILCCEADVLSIILPLQKFSCGATKSCFVNGLYRILYLLYNNRKGIRGIYLNIYLSFFTH